MRRRSSKAVRSAPQSGEARRSSTLPGALRSGDAAPERRARGGSVAVGRRGDAKCWCTSVYAIIVHHLRVGGVVQQQEAPLGLGGATGRRLDPGRCCRSAQSCNAHQTQAHSAIGRSASPPRRQRGCTHRRAPSPAAATANVARGPDVHPALSRKRRGPLPPTHECHQGPELRRRTRIDGASSAGRLPLANRRRTALALPMEAPAGHRLEVEARQSAHHQKRGSDLADDEATLRRPHISVTTRPNRPIVEHCIGGGASPDRGKRAEGNGERPDLTGHHRHRGDEVAPPGAALEAAARSRPRDVHRRARGRQPAGPARSIPAGDEEARSRAIEARALPAHEALRIGLVDARDAVAVERQLPAVEQEVEGTQRPVGSPGAACSKSIVTRSRSGPPGPVGPAQRQRHRRWGQSVGGQTVAAASGSTSPAAPEVSGLTRPDRAGRASAGRDDCAGSAYERRRRRDQSSPSGWSVHRLTAGVHASLVVDLLTCHHGVRRDPEQFADRVEAQAPATRRRISDRARQRGVFLRRGIGGAARRRPGLRGRDPKQRSGHGARSWADRRTAGAQLGGCSPRCAPSASLSR